MKNTVILTILLTLLFSCFCLECGSTEFSDINSHWAQNEIIKWEKYGIINGCGNGTFNPNGNITRAEVAAIMSRLIGLNERADISNFSDVAENAWYKEAFEKCVAAGIYKGDGNCLEPDSPVTREMFFTLLSRTFGIREENSINVNFDDIQCVSEWARGYTNALINNGYVKGVAESKISPQSEINRAEVVVLLDRMILNYIVQDGESLTKENSGISIIKSDKCNILNGFFGTLVFADDNISALFEKIDAQNIIVTGSNVVLNGVPNGTNVEILNGAKNTSVNGYVYEQCGKFVVESSGNHKHSASDAVRENEVAGNCKTKESYESVVYCSDCGKEISRKTVVGEYKDHVFENGVCEICGDKQERNDLTESTEEAVTAVPSIFLDSELTASAGETVKVNIKIKNNPGIIGAILNFKFDSKLSLIEAADGEAFNSLEMTKPGKFISDCNFVWDGLDEAAVSDGNILTLSFKVSEKALNGEVLKIECSYLQGDIVNSDFKSVDLKIINGCITIK